MIRKRREQMEHEEKELTEEEKRHLGAVKLFCEAHGKENSAEQLNQQPP